METSPATTDCDELIEPITVGCRDLALGDLLGREWLTNNRIGAYASSTAAGCNTRRYHGLLVAATAPPMGRLVALSQVSERLSTFQGVFDLATIEFPDVVRPRGVDNLAEFRCGLVPTFRYRAGEMELVREVFLAEAANAVSVRYTLLGGDAELRILPFVALRDFHSLRQHEGDGELRFETYEAGAIVQELSRPLPLLYLSARDGRFEPNSQWWYRFHYRADLARGQESFEDLYAPGEFVLHLRDGQPAEFTASLGEPTAMVFDEAVSHKRSRLAEVLQHVGDGADLSTRRLAAASDAFIVQRHFPPGAAPCWTILAGYHWFADWGRDAFIALPGLLLETGRFDRARDVFRTFADHVAGGMVPNRFDDYSSAAHYNSIDASLWFILAAERYLRATRDVAFWRGALLPPAVAILQAYTDGAQFDIHADADGLLTGGSPATQLTWMDVALGDEVVTPRHGKCVEINALWYNAHRILAERCRDLDPGLAEHCDTQASLIGSAINRAFWNEQAQCLYDCVRGGECDASIRPNQILAVSLPHSPLPPERQASVVRVVQEKLLTPFGLRTLSPDDPRYRRRYGGSWESRDRSYHQGTVWAWLLGPFVEAYLHVHGFSAFALSQADGWLGAFDEHYHVAGLGTISEIFDGDEPHTPRGCIAQAWSVGEVLRAKRLVAAHSRRGEAER